MAFNTKKEKYAFVQGLRAGTHGKKPFAKGAIVTSKAKPNSKKVKQKRTVSAKSKWQKSNQAHGRLGEQYVSKWYKNKEDARAHHLAAYHLSVKGWQEENGVMMPAERKKEYYQDVETGGSFLLPGESPFK